MGGAHARCPSALTHAVLDGMAAVAVISQSLASANRRAATSEQAHYSPNIGDFKELNYFVFFERLGPAGRPDAS